MLLPAGAWRGNRCAGSVQEMREAPLTFSEETGQSCSCTGLNSAKQPKSAESRFSPKSLQIRAQPPDTMISHW